MKKLKCPACIGLIMGLCLCLTGQASASLLGGAYSELSPSALKERLEVLYKKLQQDNQNVQLRADLARVYLAQNHFSYALDIGLALKEEGAEPQYWMPIVGAVWYIEERYELLLDTLMIENDSALNIPWAQDILVLRAKALIGQGKLDQAIRYISDLKKASPKNPLIWQTSAETYALTLNFEQAYQELSDAQRFGAKMTDIARIQGDLYRLQEDPDASMVSYERSLRADSNNVETRLRLTSLQAGLPNLAPFSQNVSYLYEILPQNPKVQLFYATMLTQKGELKAAEVVLESLIKQYPSEDAATLLLSRLYFSKGDLPSAERLATQVFADNSEDVQVRTLLGAIALKLNNPERTIELLSPYVSEMTENQRMLTLLGTAYVLHNQLDEGLHWLDRADKLKKADSQSSEIKRRSMAKAITLQPIPGLPESDLQTEVVYILAALKRGEVEDAHRRALRYVREEGESALSEYLVGLTAEASGNMESAILSYKAALLYDPKFLHADYKLTEIYLQKNKMEDAKNHIESVLSRSPKNLTAMLQMARLEEQSNHLGAAVEWLEKAEKMHIDQPEPGFVLVQLYLRMHQPEKALITADALYKRFPESVVAGHLCGELALERGSFKEAQQIFRQLVKLYPRDPDVLEGLARSEMKLGKLNAAQDTLDIILGEDASDLPALMLKSEIAFQQQDFETVMNIGDHLNTIFPNANKGLTLLGDAYWATGKVEEAISAYESAFKKEPSAKLAKSIYQSRYTLGKTEGSLTALEHWAKENPEDLVTLRFLAGAYLSTKDSHKAGEAYEQVLKHSPQDVLILNNLALIKMRVEPGSALKLAKRAYELAPKEVKVVDTYGLALLQNGMNGEAVEILQKALQKAPEDSEILDHLAKAMEMVKAERAEKH
jgi:cellulose synthase operon protein C